MTDRPDGGGLDLRPLGEQAHGDAGGVGGGGEPSGGLLGGQRGEADAPVGEPHATPRPDSLAGIADSEIAGEAAALGSADGALADAGGIPGAVGTNPSGGETVGGGAGRGEVGSGVGGDRSGLGGGDPLASPNDGSR